MSKKHLSVVLKIAISAGLIYIVIHEVAPDWKKSGAQMATAFGEAYGWVIAAVMMDGMALAANSWRWKMILDAHDVGIRFWEAFRLMLVGFFFGQFMPGGLAAGDVVRSYYVSSCTANKKMECVASVIVDRVVGSVGVVSWLMVSLLLLGGEYIGKGLVVIGVAAAIGIGTVLFFSKRVLRKVPFAAWVYERLPYRAQLIRAYEAFRHYREHKAELVACWGLSILLQLLLVVAGYCVGQSLGVRAAAYQYLVWIPIVGAITTLPISFGNIGTAEAGYVFLFPKLLAFALMMRMLLFFMAAIGGVVWWTQKRTMFRKPFRQREDPLGDVSPSGVDAPAHSPGEGE